MTVQNQNNRKGVILYSLFDIISFIALIFIIQNLNNSDPGEFIFLFAYESQFILISFFILLLILYPIQTILINKEKNISHSFKFIPENEDLKKYLYIILGLLILFFVSYFILLFLNQLSIEFMLGYTQNNNYHFNSLEILSQNTVFLELSDKFEEKLNININYLVAFFIIKHFILFSIQTIFHPEFKKDKSIIFKHLYTVGISVIMSPISMFIAMLFLVILTAIFNVKPWIPLLSMAFFQIIFRFSTNKISSKIRNW